MDTYASFADLAEHETAGVDYTILFRESDSGIAVMAPHGGGIEPGTVDIADAVAGTTHSFYAFKGLKKQGNRRLHITSNRFDEPIGLQVSMRALVAVSIHGSRDPNEIVLIGGLAGELKQNILDELTSARFHAFICNQPGLRGISPDNICNRCRQGKGVQLEISRGLREKLFDGLTTRSLRKKTGLFFTFVSALRKALD